MKPTGEDRDARASPLASLQASRRGDPSSRPWRQARGGVGRLRRFHRCEEGQAIYLMVLFLFLLAGLLFLVMNTGEKLNHKVMMQSLSLIHI